MNKNRIPDVFSLDFNWMHYLDQMNDKIQKNSENIAELEKKNHEYDLILSKLNTEEIKDTVVWVNNMKSINKIIVPILLGLILIFSIMGFHGWTKQEKPNFPTSIPTTPMGLFILPKDYRYFINDNLRLENNIYA